MEKTQVKYRYMEKKYTIIYQTLYNYGVVVAHYVPPLKMGEMTQEHDYPQHSSILTL